jgi:hypothetical protein
LGKLDQRALHALIALHEWITPRRLGRAAFTLSGPFHSKRQRHLQKSGHKLRLPPNIDNQTRISTPEIGTDSIAKRTTMRACFRELKTLPIRREAPCADRCPLRMLETWESGILQILPSGLGRSSLDLLCFRSLSPRAGRVLWDGEALTDPSFLPTNDRRAKRGVFRHLANHRRGFQMPVL